MTVRPLKRVALVLEIVLAYSRAKLLLRRRATLPDVLARLRRRDPEVRGDDQAVGTALRLSGITTRVLETLPTDSRCLISSLVLTSLLDRRGVASSLVIGVGAPGEAFGAHSWLEVGGRPVQYVGDFPRLVEL